MRKMDIEVKEVTCSETGKPMPKIPLWMAGMKVKFISDEARQKHPSPTGFVDVEPIRKSLSTGSDIEELKDFEVVAAIETEAEDFEELETEAEEVVEDEFEA